MYRTIIYKYKLYFYNKQNDFKVDILNYPVLSSLNKTIKLLKSIIKRIHILIIKWFIYHGDKIFQFF